MRTKTSVAKRSTSFSLVDWRVGVLFPSHWRYTDTDIPCHPSCPHRYTVPFCLPGSAYRPICLLDRRFGILFLSDCRYTEIPCHPSCPHRYTDTPIHRPLSSEFISGESSDFKKSGAPHQSQAPSSEIRGGKSSDFKIRGAPSVPGSVLGAKRSDFKISGAPSVPGSVLGDQGW